MFKSVASASPSPAAIDVTTAPAIVRQLPRYFEATGSLAGDIQTDTQPQTQASDCSRRRSRSYVKRGQMIVQLEPATANFTWIRPSPNLKAPKQLSNKRKKK